MTSVRRWPRSKMCWGIWSSGCGKGGQGWPRGPLQRSDRRAAALPWVGNPEALASGSAMEVAAATQWERFAAWGQ